MSIFLSVVDIYQLYPRNLKEVILTLPCSKSIANRSLIMATYFDMPIYLQNITLNIDIQTCLDSLSQLGYEVKIQDKTITIEKKSKNDTISIYAGPSGTTLRFITALSPFLANTIHIDGDYTLKKRPIEDLLWVLEEQLGVQVVYHEKQGHLPFTLIPSLNFPKTKHLTIKADKSSQFASALMMILPHLGIGATLTLIPPVYSYSYLELTLQVMQTFGFQIHKTDDFTYTYLQRTIPDKIEYFIEADWSAATFWYGYTALSNKKSTLIGLSSHSQQGESYIQKIMAKMGISSTFNQKNELEILPNSQPLSPVQADLTLLPDATPMLAVLAAFAQGKSTFTGLKTLNYKETNRIQALANELHKIGGQVEYTQDTLTIYGQTKSFIPTVIETYQDHRIAMAFAMAGIKIPYLSILDPDCVKKSYPHFWQDYKQTGMLVLPRKTVL